MNKFILFPLLFVLLAVLIQASVYFWTKVSRKRRFEDEAFNNKKKEEAMKDLRESQELFDSFARDREYNEKV